MEEIKANLNSQNIPRILLVGAGKMGSNHLRVLSAEKNLQITGVVEPFLKPDLPAGVKLYTSISQVDPNSFDAALIATPTETHFEVAKQLIEFKKDLLVEKPLASTPKQASELIDRAKAAGIKLFVGHVERSNPAVRRLKEIIAKGWIGKAIHCSFTRVGGYPQNVKSGNNVLLDLAVHDLDVFQYLFGSFHVKSSIIHSTIVPGTADTAEILLKGNSGISANIHVNWITPTKIRSVRVTGTKGVVLVDYMLQTCTLHGGDLLNSPSTEKFDYNDLQEHYKNLDKIEFGVHREEPLKVQLREWLKALQNKDSSLCTAEEASNTVVEAQRAFEVST
jgi:UDP-N-acetylglucosamine 3-dehydrogenase